MKNQKGFSLVELLVVIAIIGVLMLLSFPLIDHFVQQNNQNKYNVYRNVIEESAKEYMSDLGFLVSGCYEIKNEDQSGYAVLEEEGFLNSVDEDCKDTKVYVISDSQGKITDYKINLTCNGKEVLQPEYTSKTCDYEIVQYKEKYGAGSQDVSGANVPKLKENMIPVKYDGKDWIIADEDNVKYSSVFEEDYSWYNYNNGYWANAIILKDNVYTSDRNNIGKKIDESDVESWWVWIPRYVANIQNKDVSFSKGIYDTTKEQYVLSSAFTNKKTQEALTGFWVSKYELSNQSGKVFSIEAKQEEYITNKLATEFIEIGKSFRISHTITPSEYDAIAVLSLSQYGGKNIYSDYTTSNMSGVYNMNKDVEFTAGNLRGLKDWQVEFYCSISGNQIGWVGNRFYAPIYPDFPSWFNFSGTSNLVQQPYNDSYFKENIIDIVNLDYKWYVSGEIYPPTKCTGSYGCAKDGSKIENEEGQGSAYYEHGKIMSSPNHYDFDYLGNKLDWFIAGYPKYNVSYDGKWSIVKQPSTETEIARLWMFKGNNGINSYETSYSDITIDRSIEEIKQDYYDKCRPNGKKFTLTIYLSSITKYQARVRSVIY